MVGASANSRFKDQGNTSTANIVMKGKTAEPNEGDIQKKWNKETRDLRAVIYMTVCILNVYNLVVKTYQKERQK